MNVQGELELTTGALELPSLVGHWDFSDISSLFLDSARTMPVTTDGDVVKGATDLSGNGNHLDAGAGDGLNFRTGIKNGLSVVENFGSTAKYLENAALNLGSPHAFVAVGRIPSAPLDALFGHSFISSQPGVGLQTNIQLIPTESRYFSTQAARVTSVLESPPTADVWHIWVFDMDGVLNPVYLENTFDVNNAAGALERAFGFRFMHDDNLGFGIWDSYGAEVYMFDGVFSSATRIALVNSLKTKWDIA